jgi:hypothetical protein
MRSTHWLLLAALFLLVGCPTGDDDDTTAGDDDDSTPIGEPPTLDAVDVCEVPITEVSCGEQNVFSFAVEYRLTMSDPDGDLVLPRYCIAIDGNPFNCASVERTIPSGGRLDIQFGCARWGRGDTSSYEAYIEDQEGNESERVTGSWDVAVQPGDADCPAN